MTALTIILLTFLAVLVYLLFAPFYIEIDSIKGLLKIRFHRLASAEMFYVEDAPMLRVVIIGWRREFNIFKIITDKKIAAPIKKANKLKAKGIPFKMTYKRAMGF